MNSSVRHFVAEFVGTFALVFIGSGALLMVQRTNTPDGLLVVALAHGIILALMVSATMNVSGGHLNPAVTLGMVVTKRIAPTMAGVHIVAQLAGAAFGAFVLKWTIAAQTFSAARGGGQAVAMDVTMSQAITLEAVATFFLVFVIFGTAVNPEAPKLGGMAIGLTIGADILAIGPLTGGSMNPARSFGPALASGIWEGQVVFWIGPAIGAIVAALVWEYLLLRRPTSAS